MPLRPAHRSPPHRMHGLSPAPTSPIRPARPPRSWVNLWSVDAVLKLLPTLASCAAMIFTLEHFSHPLALPGTLLSINLLFHAVRMAMGATLEDCMDHGWVLRPAVRGWWGWCDVAYGGGGM